MTLAEENSIELTREQAQAYFSQLNPPSGELADDEFYNVAGGSGEKTNTSNIKSNLIGEYIN